MKNSRLLGALCAVIFIFLSTATSAELIDNGGGLIYDTVLDITWAQPGVRRTWNDAKSWVEGLRLGGATDWRLPYMSVAEGAGPFTGNAVDCNTASEAACQDNELGYMFYHNLSGTYGQSILTSGDPDLALFPTLIPGDCWSGTEWITDWSWVFFLHNGAQVLFEREYELSNLPWAVHAGNVGTVPASNVSLHYTDAASAKDTGPKTGTFDIFLIPPGPVGDNGYEENRTALEFDISEIPTGSTIQSTTLTLNYTLVTDPIRQISLYGYPGNGLVYDQSQINTDFTAGVHIQDSNLAISQPDVEYDATLFVQDLIDDGNSYAGFNLRESATAGCCGLNVIFILEGEFTQPVLEITYFEPTPGKQIMILSQKVMELNTKKGISNAMDSKLKNAYEALDDSNQKNDGAAINTMQAFIYSVDAQRGKELSDYEADSLNAAAQEIIDNLSK